MKKTIVSALAGLLAAGAVTATATSASAYVVCNRDGDCWHTHARVVRDGWAYHPDDWYFHRTWNDDRDHHWREYHEGRGFWRGGVWVPMP